MSGGRLSGGRLSVELALRSAPLYAPVTTRRLLARGRLQVCVGRHAPALARGASASCHKTTRRKWPGADGVAPALTTPPADTGERARVRASACVREELLTLETRDTRRPKTELWKTRAVIMAARPIADRHTRSNACFIAAIRPCKWSRLLMWVAAAATPFCIRPTNVKRYRYSQFLVDMLAALSQMQS